MSDLLLARLDGSRRHLRTTLLAQGAVATLLTLLAVVAGFFIVDWLAVNRILALGWGDLLARVVLLLVAVAVLARIAWRTVLAEMRMVRSDDEIALRVERINRALGGRLISTVQLTRRRDAEAGGSISADLIAGLAEQTEARAADIDFAGIVNRRPLKRLALIALAALAITGGLIAWRSDYALALGARLLLRAVDYPTDTTILAVSAGGRVAQGDPFPIEIEVDATRHVPASASAQVRFVGGRTVTLALTRVVDSPSGKVLFRGQIKQALEDFSFRPAAHDAQWPRWVEVVATPRPAIGGLKVRCVYPDYLRQEPSEGTTGDLRVPVGTVVQVSAIASKALASATLTRRSNASPEPAVEAMSIADERTLRGEFTVDGSGTWSLELRDHDDLTNPEPPQYTISAILDRAPVIVIASPGQDKVASPTARWPLRFTVKDDHGIGPGALKYVIEMGETIQSSETAPQPEPVPVAIQLDGLASPGELAVSREAVFDLGKLSLQPGMRVTYWLEVADDRTPQANLGVSQRYRFSIVDPETLRAEIERQRAELAERLKTLRDRQQDARDGVDTLRKRATTR